MTPNDTIDLDAATLIGQRKEPNALRAITERLHVKRMGPADHIRTKHEIKALLESGGGDMKTADAIIARARARLAARNEQKVTEAERQRQGLQQ